MTKYELLYGVTVDHFPNEKENVQEKRDLATQMYGKKYLEEYSEQQQVELHEINQAIRWANKILRDIDE